LHKIREEAAGMTGKEIIKRVLDFNDPPRMGYHFNAPNPSDIMVLYDISAKAPDGEYQEWGRYPELLEKLPGFKGEVCRLDGNTYGRLGGKTKGECVLGALEGGWERLDEYTETVLAPYLRTENYEMDRLSQWAEENADRFTVAAVSSLQAVARDARRMDNMLADTVLEPESLRRLVDACAGIAAAQADILHGCGFDGAMIFDDWGLQHSLYLNPESWRAIWKEPYARVAERIHSHGMKLMLHSCGYIMDILDDFVEIGVDAFQFDQPALYDFDVLAGQINGKATLWSPVDIQKVLPTGDKAKIQAEAARMIGAFHKGGGLIAKDYPSLADVGVKDEWAQYARDVFIDSASK